MTHWRHRLTYVWAALLALCCAPRRARDTRSFDEWRKRFAHVRRARASRVRRTPALRRRAAGHPVFDELRNQPESKEQLWQYSTARIRLATGHR